MKKLILICTVLMLVTSCEKKTASLDRIEVTGSRINLDRGKYLAYEHSIDVDVDEAQAKGLYDQLIENCKADPSSTCTVLDANFSQDRTIYARLKLRVKKADVETLIGIASKAGRIASQTTHVEDLSGPILDTNRRLEMARQYQKKLFELEKRAGADVDSLIKVSKELSTVQSDIEEVTGESAKLARRVDLDILNIAIHTLEGRSFFAPISRALAGFGGNLATGISTFIDALAYTLPWLIALIAAFFGVRKIWRRAKAKNS